MSCWLRALRRWYVLGSVGLDRTVLRTADACWSKRLGSGPGGGGARD